MREKRPKYNRITFIITYVLAIITTVIHYRVGYHLYLCCPYNYDYMLFNLLVFVIRYVLPVFLTAFFIQIMLKITKKKWNLNYTFRDILSSFVVKVFSVLNAFIFFLNYIVTYKNCGQETPISEFIRSIVEWAFPLNIDGYATIAVLLLTTIYLIDSKTIDKEKENRERL